MIEGAPNVTRATPVPANPPPLQGGSPGLGTWSTSQHSGPVDAAEAKAVEDALARTLARLCEITVEDYEAVGLGPERFARELRAGVPPAPYGLGRHGPRQSWSGGRLTTAQ